MKTFLILLTSVFALGSNLQADSGNWVGQYSELLGKYVTPDGVKYNEWHKDSADMAKLKSVVDGIAAQSLSGLSEDEKLAFYINAYNAWTVFHFLERHPYNNDNFLKRNRFFGSDIIEVAGKKMSFNHLEHGIIRPEFNEPRVHFALNCASASCPPLLDRAFAEATLEADLQALTLDYVNDNPEGVTLADGGKVARVSQIFDWFAEDFNDGDVKGFLNEFRKNPLKKDTTIEFQKYNWSRNEAK
tara:strand:+ start:1728 stop:2459 length:732 start_codon:yes stop_codon:yes gene_type:complete